MRPKSGAIQDWRRKNKYSLPSEIGVLVAVTRIYKAASLFAADAPYWVGVVEFEDGERTVGQLVDEEGWRPMIGERVRACRRRIFADGSEGIIHYGIKWERFGGE